MKIPPESQTAVSAVSLKTTGRRHRSSVRRFVIRTAERHSANVAKRVLVAFIALNVLVLQKERAQGQGLGAMTGSRRPG
jgi:hypothetical protein